MNERVKYKKNQQLDGHDQLSRYYHGSPRKKRTWKQEFKKTQRFPAEEHITFDLMI